MTQKGLIDRIVDVMGLDVDQSISKSTPCLKAPVIKDIYGDLRSESLAHTRIVGTLLYLPGHSRPDTS